MGCAEASRWHLESCAEASDLKASETAKIVCSRTLVLGVSAAVAIHRRRRHGKAKAAALVSAVVAVPADPIRRPSLANRMSGT